MRDNKNYLSILHLSKLKNLVCSFSSCKKVCYQGSQSTPERLKSRMIPAKFLWQAHFPRALDAFNEATPLMMTMLAAARAETNKTRTYRLLCMHTHTLLLYVLVRRGTGFFVPQMQRRSAVWNLILFASAWYEAAHGRGRGALSLCILGGGWISGRNFSETHALAGIQIGFADKPWQPAKQDYGQTHADFVCFRFCCC